MVGDERKEAPRVFPDGCGVRMPGIGVGPPLGNSRTRVGCREAGPPRRQAQRGCRCQAQQV